LSSRIPHGEPVTVAKLAMIEAAENVLRDLGFVEVRVRHHEGRSAKGEGIGEKDEVRSGLSTSHVTPLTPQSLARIEVGRDEMARLLEADMRARVAAALREIGYAHVTVDLQGYRRGSLNEGFPGQVREGATGVRAAGGPARAAG